MSQRFLFGEDHQLPAKIIRAVIWSGTMGVLWALPFIAFGLATVLSPSYQSPPLEEDYSGIAYGLIFIGLGMCSVVAFFIGATVGLLAGFYAEPKEPFFPCGVPLFRSALKWIGITLLLMFLGAVAAIL